jgi:hypothetical protein
MRDVKERRAQRIQAKEAKQALVRSKKRSIEEDEVDQPRKRVRTTAPRTRDAGDSHTTSMGLNTGVVQQSSRTISNTERGSAAIDQGIQSEELVSHFGRSGRAIRLPTRFR